MKQINNIHGFSVKRFMVPGIICIGLFATSTAFAASPNMVQKARTPVQRDVPMMMLALPGRGAVLSTPGQIATIIIENEAGSVCNTYLARTDKAGVLEIPVVRTAHCSSPRIVVHR